MSWTDGTSNVFLHNSALEPLPTEEILKVRPFPESNGTIFFFLLKHWNDFYLMGWVLSDRAIDT